MTRTRTSAVSLALTLVFAALPAAAWEVNPAATRGDFGELHERLAAAAHFWPRHGAKPEGLLGFEVWIDSSVDTRFGGQDFAATAIDGDLPGDLLAIARVGVRKGLPGRIDLGAAYGRAVGGDLELLSGEVSWAALEGGAVSPAVGFRLSGTRTLEGGTYELTQLGLEVLVSKGFAVVTPFAGAGLVRSESRLERDLPGGDFREETTDPVLFAGVAVKLLVPRLTFEVEQSGPLTQAAVRLGFGF
jgi:hypothetical protein